MISSHHIFKIILLVCFSTASSCSSGPAEKPLPKSISSPTYLLDQGIQQYNNNDYAKAISIFDKALFQYRSIDNQEGIAKSCLNLAKAYMAINNNETATKYLTKAETIINQAALDNLKEHLSLLKSSLAISQGAYGDATEELAIVLKSTDTATRLAALKNRTNIAFLDKAKDKEEWLSQYKSLQKTNTNQTNSHLARIYRFDAELSSDETRQTKLLTQSLELSRKRADRPAIAATLTQWAALDSSNERLENAEDKYIRALFIRHQMGDVKNSLIILNQLNGIYLKTNNSKQARTEKLINELSNNNMRQWNTLFSNYDNYPK